MAKRTNPEDEHVKEIKEMISREYKSFQEDEKLGRIPRGFYEKACAVSEKLLKIDPDKNTKKKLEESIAFSHLRVTPRGVASFTLLATFAMCFITLMLILSHQLLTVPVENVTGKSADVLCIKGTYSPATSSCMGNGFGLDMGNGLFIMLISIPIAIYLYIYPTHLRKKYEMEVGSDMVSAILYMVVYMRNNPSLENAVEFAAKNISGPLAGELRKIMWDVRIGGYLTINAALLDYAKRWKQNKEFVESIELLIASLKQTGERRTGMLDEAVRTILEGNRESARHYVQNLKMPILVINAMGMILPVMGLVMFPIIALFLGVSVGILFIVYDLALPLILFFVINNTLEKRPSTYGKINISDHPDLPPPGKIFLGKKTVSVLPIAIAISAAIIILGVFAFQLEASTVAKGESVEGIMSALILTFGIMAGPAAYYLILNSQRVAIQKKVKKIEDEFQEAMFELGNSVVSGVPIETAMEDATKRMEGLKIREMFEMAVSNIRKFGMTMEQAFFDKEYGATRYYPSVLIKSIIKTVAEASKKGVRVASTAMFSMARYLRGLHKTQEQIREALSDVASSVKFQSYILTPLITGVVSTLAIIIMRIVKDLGDKAVLTTTPGAASGLGGLFAGIGLENVGITPFQFILVVSIYLVETVVLLIYLMTGIESGEDPIERGYKTGQTLVVAIIVYAITVVGTVMMFGPLANVAG